MAPRWIPAVTPHTTFIPLYTPPKASNGAGPADKGSLRQRKNAGDVDGVVTIKNCRYNPYCVKPNHRRT
jgi:hypothetical protein